MKIRINGYVQKAYPFFYLPVKPVEKDGHYKACKLFSQVLIVYHYLSNLNRFTSRKKLAIINSEKGNKKSLGQEALRNKNSKGAGEGCREQAPGSEGEA